MSSSLLAKRWKPNVNVFISNFMSAISCFMSTISNFILVLSFSLELTSPQKKNPLLLQQHLLGLLIFKFQFSSFWLEVRGPNVFLEAFSVCTEEAMEIYRDVCSALLFGPMKMLWACAVLVLLTRIKSFLLIELTHFSLKDISLETCGRRVPCLFLCWSSIQVRNKCSLLSKLSSC